ncbi:MAG: VTT domain-containing protein [Rickettsiaceae bacterium]
MKIKKSMPLLMILGLSITAWILDLHHYLSFETFKAHQKSLEQFIANHRVVSLFLYGATYIAVVTLSLPAATFMTLAGGFLFGQWVGTSVVVTAATIGACFFFLIARMASSDLLSKKAGGFATKMQKGFQENALSYLLTLRLIPIFPFVAVNLAAAFFQVPLKIFALGTFFGIIPGSLVYVSMGVALREVIQKPDFSPGLILDPKILLAFIGLGILSLLPVFYRHLKKK